MDDEASRSIFKEYRDVRKQAGGFLACYNPRLAVVTLQPIKGLVLMLQYCLLTYSCRKR